MAGAKIKWHGQQFIKGLESEMERRMDLAAEVVASQMRRNVSESGVEAPSLPGELPHAVTGKLRQSCTWERQGALTRRVGASVMYAVYLEHGTSRMAPRPFVYRTVLEMQDAIKKIMTRKL